MTAPTPKAVPKRVPLRKEEVRLLAAAALTTVVRKSNGRRPTHVTRTILIKRLMEAGGPEKLALSDDICGSRAVCALLMDDIVPKIARDIGERWMRDEMSFANVQSCALGLEWLLGQIYRRAEQDHRPAPPNRHILIAKPEGEMHRLGMIVAADQFRRLGCAVDVLDVNAPEALPRALRARNYAMVGFAAATRRSLEQVSRLTDVIRRTAPNLPIVLGGSAAVNLPQEASATRVDYVASNVSEAYTFGCFSHQQNVVSSPPTSQRNEDRAPA